MEQFTEIKLTERQFEIVKDIFAVKAKIQQEINLLSQRESEFIINLCEARGIEAVQGIKFEGQSMFVPSKEEKQESKKAKK